jgi:amidase
MHIEPLHGALPQGIYPDALALKAALTAGEMTALAALEACLAAIDERNDELNALVYLDREAARTQARACDEASEEFGPLHGIPVTIKECFDWKGHPTTWGDPSRRDHRARRDAAIVERLKKAGAVIIGKSNIPPYLSDWETDNPLFGATRNPYDPSRSAGGSSGGSASAVAAGFSYLDIGSDQGGSIRLPAHYCGVHGLKPSWGKIPLLGHSPLGERRTPDIGAAGPLARSARDVALAFDVLADEPGTSRELTLKDLRVAVMLDESICPLDVDYKEALEGYVDQLQGHGINVHQAKPEIDMTRATEVMNLLVRAETATKAGIIEDFRRWNGIKSKESEFQEIAKRGKELSHLDWLSLHEERLALIEQIEQFFVTFDVLLCPAGASAAAPLRPKMHVSDRTIPVNGVEVPVLKQHALYMLGSLCYLPAHVMPIGRTDSGLAAGIQMIGPYGSDASLLAMAQAFSELR